MNELFPYQKIGNGADGIEPQEYERWLESDDSIDTNYWRWLAKHALAEGQKEG